MPGRTGDRRAASVISRREGERPMGKKPVLGLVGLCVGLALSGCKNCGCGWASKNSRSDGDPPVAHVRKDGKTTTERSVAAKRGTPAQKKNPYDYPADSY